MRNFTAKEFADDTLNTLGTGTGTGDNITVAMNGSGENEEDSGKWYKKSLSTLWAYIKSKVESLGYKTTDTWKKATTSQEGYVPMLALADLTKGAKKETIDAQGSDYVLTYHARKENAQDVVESEPVWRRLPLNAFLYEPNTDTNTHYTTLLLVGQKGTKANDWSGPDNTYLKIYDDNRARTPIKVKGKDGIYVVANESEGNCLEIGWDGFFLSDGMQVKGGTGIQAVPDETNMRVTLYLDPYAPLQLLQCNQATNGANTISGSNFPWSNLRTVWVNVYGTQSAAGTNYVTLNIHGQGAKNIMTGAGGTKLQQKHFKNGIYHLMVAENEGFYILSCPIATTQALLQ